MGFFQFFDKRVGVVSWYGQNTNIFAHLLHLDNVRLLYFLQNHIFRLKSSEKYWKSNCLLQVNFENRNRVNWHQLMFYIKWWVFVIIKMPCFHIYNIFKCHFKPNQKCQRDMKHPVRLAKAGGRGYSPPPQPPISGGPDVWTSFSEGSVIPTSKISRLNLVFPDSNFIYLDTKSEDIYFI